MKICMPRGDIRDVRFTVYDHTGQRICTVPFDEIYVTFKKPVKAVTPGQAAVFYDGDVCLGGGTIEKVYKDNKEIEYL